jgi:hypothetical protein
MGITFSVKDDPKYNPYIGRKIVCKDKIVYKNGCVAPRVSIYKKDSIQTPPNDEFRLVLAEGIMFEITDVYKCSSIDAGDWIEWEIKFIGVNLDRNIVSIQRYNKDLKKFVDIYAENVSITDPVRVSDTFIKENGFRAFARDFN